MIQILFVEAFDYVVGHLLTVHSVVTVLRPLPTAPVGHQHRRQERRVGVLHLHEPRRVRHLLAIELDVHPVPAQVVRDEVGFELLLGDGVNMTGHPAAIDNYLQIAKPGSSAVN